MPAGMHIRIAGLFFQPFIDRGRRRKSDWGAALSSSQSAV